MATGCSPEQLEFHTLGRRDVIGRLDGGRITSDGGGLLLRAMDKRLGLCWLLKVCPVVAAAGGPATGAYSEYPFGRGEPIRGLQANLDISDDFRAPGAEMSRRWLTTDGHGYESGRQALFRRR